ncbi:hypothetical protein SOP85_31190, partial [Pseudomonas sp. YuFO20]|nr:hypothetical protein [Pseudomonas sp. YuFO20]
RSHIGPSPNTNSVSSADRMWELGQLRDTLQDLVEHCQGDDRPDCPILKSLESGCCANAGPV